MKVAHIHPTVTSIPGGVERHIIDLARYQIKYGVNVEILSIEKSKNNSNFERLKFIRTLGSRIELLKRVKYSDYDIIHVHGYRVPLSSIVAIYAKSFNKKVILTTHGIYPWRNIIDAIIKTGYDLSLGISLIHSCDAIIALTPETKEAIEKLCIRNNNIFIVPNSIDTERFSNLPDPYEAALKLNIDLDCWVITYIGRLDWNKGLEYIVYSLYMLIKYYNIKDIIFILAGKDYGYWNKIKQIGQKLNILGKIRYLGVINDKLLLHLYSVTKVLILPSIYEGLPTVALEAMAAGKPVIATPGGGTSYLIKHMWNGILVKYGDPIGISKAITTLYNDKKLYNSISINARKTVINNYSWKMNAQRIIKIYKFVL